MLITNAAGLQLTSASHADLRFRPNEKDARASPLPSNRLSPQSIRLNFWLYGLRRAKTLRSLRRSGGFAIRPHLIRPFGRICNPAALNTPVRADLQSDRT